MVATLRAGFAHQRLARLAHDEGVELDISELPKRPSGRIERDAADALFESVRDELFALLADNVTAVLKKDAWEMPYLFQWLQHAGNVDAQEMYRVFNCGIGMVVIVAAEDAAMAADQLRSTGETVYNLGTIEARAEGQAQTVVV